MIWSTLEFPSFNFNSILDGFCILKGMSYMMPLSRHALSLQTGLHRWFILGTVIPPTTAILPDFTFFIYYIILCNLLPLVWYNMGQQLIIYHILYNGLQMYIQSSKLNNT